MGGMVDEPLAGIVGPIPGASNESGKVMVIAPGDARAAGKAGEIGKLAGGPRLEKAGFIAGAGILIDGGLTAR